MCVLFSQVSHAKWGKSRVEEKGRRTSCRTSCGSRPSRRRCRSRMSCRAARRAALFASSSCKQFSLFYLSSHLECKHGNSHRRPANKKLKTGIWKTEGRERTRLRRVLSSACFLSACRRRSWPGSWMLCSHWVSIVAEYTDGDGESEVIEGILSGRRAPEGVRRCERGERGERRRRGGDSTQLSFPARPRHPTTIADCCLPQRGGRSSPRAPGPLSCIRPSGRRR